MFAWLVIGGCDLDEWDKAFPVQGLGRTAAKRNKVDPLMRAHCGEAICKSTNGERHAHNQRSRDRSGVVLNRHARNKSDLLIL